MKMLGTQNGTLKLALVSMGATLLLALACGTSTEPAEPLANTEVTSSAPIEAEPESASVPSAATSPASTEGDSGAAEVVPSELEPDAVVLPPTKAEPEANTVSPAEAQDDTPTAVVTEPKADSAPVGNKVGLRIPDFAITLVDGTTVSSADLLAQRQPTFLFFFETW